VGYCRNARFGEAGEVALIGVVPEARGIGLGRALLRWGVQWLASQGVEPLYLMVDGENEGALRLYRSEGFGVARTRIHWSRDFTG
jgi:ribosomal protein S18 acetylase RimI-like enzyme